MFIDLDGKDIIVPRGGDNNDQFRARIIRLLRNLTNDELVWIWNGDKVVLN